MAEDRLGGIPTWNCTCQGCPEIQIMVGDDEVQDITMDFDAAVDGIGITYKGCKQGNKRKIIPVKLENLETKSDDGTVELNYID